jgi:hypothetical protein
VYCTQRRKTNINSRWLLNEHRCGCGYAGRMRIFGSVNACGSQEAVCRKWLCEQPAMMDTGTELRGETLQNEADCVEI